MNDLLAKAQWPIRTERLLVRRAVAADAEATWHFRRLPEVTEWLTFAPEDLDDYRGSYLEPGRLATSLVIEHDGEIIGDLMLRVEDAWSQREVAPQARNVQAELGWALDPRHSGHGYATEAVRAVIDLCFGPLGLRRVYAQCFAPNRPSWRLMERLGMRRELHTVKESLHRSGVWHDGLLYAILAEEWSQKAGQGIAGP